MPRECEICRKRVEVGYQYTYRGLAHYYRGLHAGDRGDPDLRTALADFAEAVKRDPSMAAKVKGAAEEARKRLGEE